VHNTGTYVFCNEITDYIKHSTNKHGPNCWCNMWPSLLVFALNSTSAQWRVDKLSKWHAAMLLLPEYCHQFIWKIHTFSLLHSTGRNVQHGMWDIPVLDMWICIFHEDMHKKNNLHISAPTPSDLDLWPRDLKLFYQLLLILETYPGSLNIAWFLFSSKQLTWDIQMDGM